MSDLRKVNMMFNHPSYIVLLDSCDACAIRGNLEGEFRNAKENKISFFIFEDSLTNEFTIEEIELGQIYTARYDYTHEEIVQKNWVVEFAE